MYRSQCRRLVGIFLLVSLVCACGQSQDQRQVAATPAFVGSLACAGCHASQFSAWQTSHHALAMQPASDTSILGDFQGIEFDYFGAKTFFLKSAGAAIVRTQDANGAVQDFPVRYTFGVDPLQQYLVETDGGRLQVLPFAWDSRDSASGGQRWMHLYPDEEIAPGDALHWTGREQNWNFMCAECHSTNVEMGYDANTDSFNTTFDEISVGCEACHGPASLHLQQAKENTFQNSRKGLQVNLDDLGRAHWRMNTETGIASRSEPLLSATRQPESCGRCHSRRAVASKEYRHDRPLLDTHQPALLDELLYFDDGQIRDEVFVYGSFLQSKMYRAGVTCSNCHEPHGLGLTTGQELDAVCAQCHLQTRYDTIEHSGHASDVVACVDCHMPDRTYMQVDDRRDHSFRIPRPDLTQSIGVPNACQQCHAEQTAEWAVENLRTWHGAQQRDHFGSALASSRREQSNDGLLSIVTQPAYPGIARATALTELALPFDQAEADAVAAGLVDPDPLIRVAALRQHRNFPVEWRLQQGVELLGDRAAAVRNAAVLAYAGIHELLPANSKARFNEAAQDYRELQISLLNRPESHISLADLELALGKSDTAIAYYESGLALAPEYTLARINYADALRQLGNDERGHTVLQEGLQLDPANAALQHSLGLLLVRIDKRREALHALREAVRLDPSNARYRYVLEIAELEISDDETSTP